MQGVKDVGTNHFRDLDPGKSYVVEYVVDRMSCQTTGICKQVVVVVRGVKPATAGLWATIEVVSFDEASFDEAPFDDASLHVLSKQRPCGELLGNSLCVRPGRIIWETCSGEKRDD